MSFSQQHSKQLSKAFATLFVTCEERLNDAIAQGALREKLVLVFSMHWPSSGAQHLLEHLKNSPDTCRLIDEHFISFFVERFEDYLTDLKFQDFHESTQNLNGGWPLLIIIDPISRKPIYSSTYLFAKEPDGIFAQLSSVLTLIDQPSSNVATIVNSLNDRRKAIEVINNKQALNLVSLFDRFVTSINQNGDHEWGGLATTPKALHPILLTSLFDLVLFIERDSETDLNIKKSFDFLMLTITSLLKTGIRDHLDGALFSCSLDRHWQIPEFEKYVTDNAILAELLVKLAHFTGNGWFANAAYEIFNWLDTMQDEIGLYYAYSSYSQSQSEQANAYTFSVEQVREHLSENDWPLALYAFGFDKGPNFENRWHLQNWYSEASLTKKSGKTIKEVQFKLPQIKNQLLQLRESQLSLSYGSSQSSFHNLVVATAQIRSGQLLKQEHLINKGISVFKQVMKQQRQQSLSSLQHLVLILDNMLEQLKIEWSENTFNQLVNYLNQALNIIDEKDRFEQWLQDYPTYDNALKNPLSNLIEQCLSLYHLTNDGYYYQRYLDLKSILKERVSSNFLGHASMLATMAKCEYQKSIILLGNGIDQTDWRESILERQLKFQVFSPSSDRVTTLKKIYNDESTSMSAVIANGANSTVVNDKQTLLELLSIKDV